jgi:hypothetical protein
MKRVETTCTGRWGDEVIDNLWFELKNGGEAVNGVGEGAADRRRRRLHPTAAYLDTGRLLILHVCSLCQVSFQS